MNVCVGEVGVGQKDVLLFKFELLFLKSALCRVYACDIGWKINKIVLDFFLFRSVGDEAFPFEFIDVDFLGER